MYFVKQPRRVPVPPFVIDRFPRGIARRKQPPLATAAYQIQDGLEYVYRVMKLPVFHKIREHANQNEPLLRLYPGDVDIGIIIFLWQIVMLVVKQYKMLI